MGRAAGMGIMGVGRLHIATGLRRAHILIRPSADLARRGDCGWTSAPAA